MIHVGTGSCETIVEMSRKVSPHIAAEVVMRTVLRLLAAFLLTASAAQAGPERLRFQGTVTDLPGVTIVDGNYEFLVRIYDQATGGTLKYSQTVTAYVAAGAYSLDLAPSVAGQLSSAFADWPRFLEVTVVSGPGGSINQLLLPRQEITSVPFVLADIPVGAIILWMDGPTCPQGYAEVTALRNVTVRGADTGNSNSGIPNDPGVGCPGGPGCNAAQGQYDDTLDVSEMPSHSHGLTTTNSYAGGPSQNMFNQAPGPLNVTTQTSAVGAGQAHYHPFATVLFCKRQ
jgi:hypothetical protein